jgi:fumarate reductase subunit D
MTSPARKSNEPFFWALFSAGGMITALIAPVLIVIVGFLVPADAVHFSRLQDIFSNALGRLAVFGVAALTFFHWAHRFRHSLIEMGLKPVANLVAILSYLTAVAGAVWAAVVAFG